MIFHILVNALKLEHTSELRPEESDSDEELSPGRPTSVPSKATDVHGDQVAGPHINQLVFWQFMQKMRGKNDGYELKGN